MNPVKSSPAGCIPECSNLLIGSTPVSTISGPWMHWVTFPASSYPGFNLSEGQVNLQQPMAIAPLTDLWVVMYVCQLSRLKFSAPVMPMYFYWIYTNIYSISHMTSSWLPCWLCHNLTWLPIHSIDIYTLIILVKFQNFFTPGFHLTQWLHMVPVENLGRMPVDVTEILQLDPWIKADLV